ncbi:unnamed protein product [Ambrosiozyma monospora]|uniref:Unnamed protein product n=1 Tax=Ambrosiozyma monospora TaxID=43982 RepID=A0A9W7DKD8_AMBMO|nr:unnamed protein product [Ambrosiozyma monospora]
MNLSSNTLSYSSSKIQEQETTKHKDYKIKTKSRSKSPDLKDSKNHKSKSQETKKSKEPKDPKDPKKSKEDDPVELFTPKAREGTTVTIAPAFEEVNNNNDELAELRGEGRYFGVADPEASQPVLS